MTSRPTKPTTILNRIVTAAGVELNDNGTASTAAVVPALHQPMK